MSSVKETAIEILQKMPDDCTWEQILYRLHSRQHIEAGLKDIAEGRVVPDEELDKEFGQTEVTNAANFESPSWHWPAR